MSILSKPYFHSEPAAFEHLEEVLWRGEPVCPHCGSINNATKLQGKATRIGVWKCKDRYCRKQFTVKVGTVFEHGRIPLNKMLQAVHLMASSKKGISAHQLHRILDIQYKSAWFLAHRIREAMAGGDLSPFGSDGGAVEVDETELCDVRPWLNRAIFLSPTQFGLNRMPPLSFILAIMYFTNQTPWCRVNLFI